MAFVKKTMSLLPMFSPLRHMSSIPRVSEQIVTITAIDRDGERHVIKGLVGQSVLRTLIRNKLETKERTPTEEVDCSNGNDEVTIASEWLTKIPPPTQAELDVLRTVSPTGAVSTHSRLGSQVKLTKELDGMTVAMAEWRPYYTL